MNEMTMTVMNERYSFADLGSGWGSAIKTETGKR